MGAKESILASALWGSKPKQDIRDLIYGCRHGFRHIFLLAGIYMIDARAFSRMFPHSHIRSIEREKDFYRIQHSKELWYRNVFCTKETFSNYIRRTDCEGPYDLWALDFQGIYCRKIEEDLEQLFKWTHKIGTIITLTLSMARDDFEHLKRTICYETICNCRESLYRGKKKGDGQKMKVIALAIHHIAKSKGYWLKTLEKKDYQNYAKKGDTLGGPMMFFMFKVTRVPQKDTK